MRGGERRRGLLFLLSRWAPAQSASESLSATSASDATAAAAAAGRADRCPEQAAAAWRWLLVRCAERRPGRPQAALPVLSATGPDSLASRLRLPGAMVERATLPPPGSVLRSSFGTVGRPCRPRLCSPFGPATVLLAVVAGSVASPDLGLGVRACPRCCGGPDRASWTCHAGAGTPSGALDERQPPRKRRGVQFAPCSLVAASLGFSKEGSLSGGQAAATAAPFACSVGVSSSSACTRVEVGGREAQGDQVAR